MLIDELLLADIYSPWVIILLVSAGFFVGFINTLAGSGTIISYTVYMSLGLPASYANGTIRIGVIMQTLAASIAFKRGSVLDIKKGLLIGLPIVIGSMIGAQIAVNIDTEIFKYFVVAVMLLMLAFLIFNPNKWIEKQETNKKELPYFWQFIIYLLIGIYGGFIHIGVGIFLLGALVLISGYDLLRANALKVFVVFLYSPFALCIYIYNDHVHYALGLISAVGNIFGGLLASHLAITWGTKFIHYFLLVIIVLFSAKTLGVFDFIFQFFA